MSKRSLISPIVLDLGAKCTGAYLAHYEAYSTPDKIEKEARVYQLEKDSYTLLMTHRAAARHQRRGHDRRQMVKRLFKLIWEKHFALEWDKDVQQTISFLLNRRGFSFLTEEYNTEILSQFPKEAYELLPEKLKIGQNKNGKYDFVSALTEWANKGEGEVKNLFQEILYKAYCETIRKHCQKKKANKSIVKEAKGPVKLVDTPKFVFERVFAQLPKLKRRLETEEYTFKNNDGKKVSAKYNKGETFSILSFINNNNSKTAKEMQAELPEEEQKEWLFNPESDFDMERSEEKLSDLENVDIKLHLRHFAFALHKILNELQSGGRHRSKYFDEVKEVLKNQRTKERKKNGSLIGEDYIDRFCKKLAKGEYEPLTSDELSKLIAHLSNFELKPIRKYFNDKKHKKGDHWEEKRLNKIFENWILREWRIDLAKDKYKAHGEKGDYKALCKKWKEYAGRKQGKILDFFLNTEPFCTIPPYQDNNNRRPPKCQSLILNPEFLDKSCPEWQKRLGELQKLDLVKEYLGDFQARLTELESSKEKGYFSLESTMLSKESKTDAEKKKSKNDIRAADSQRRKLKALDARILQFIFDRVKDADPLKLNEIFSHAKKWRQEQSTEKEKKAALEKLAKAMEDSQLLESLKSPVNQSSKDLFSEGSFLHLVCAYYKMRQRARDGRVFIHPEYRFVKGRGCENTGRFNAKDHLLSYCNHKPRQKKYQSFSDLAGVLQVSPQELKALIQRQEGKTVDEKLFNYLKGIHALETNCVRAAKEQKERRGQLKLDIQNIHSLIYYRRKEEKLSQKEVQKEVKEILKNSRVREAYALHNFCERAKELCLKLTEALYDLEKQEKQQKELHKNPAAAVYLLAQINNIAFKERSGNAKICAVCSVDNAQRMQMLTSKASKESHTKAQRLPAIETRQLDGAVMRMARIVGGAIADDKWRKIEEVLKGDKEVHIPIIMESNRFEFEPSLREIKNKTKKGDAALPEAAEAKAVEKKERIENASQGVCPYTGEETNTGGIDHIIPRSSTRWGTLNDEANLIWASDKGSKKIKGEQELPLSKLKPAYKKRQFGDKSDKGIKEWIRDQIEDAEGQDFKFGKYRSFINLSPDEQRAFRHALFLIGDPLRKKVICAIDHHTRSLVNGTQRYFAEVLANELHKKAKSTGKERLLAFDYFGVEAQDNSRGDGIYNLRKELIENENYRPDLKKYNKEKGKTQDLYSHLIDAQVAFCMAVDAHREEGSLKLKLGDSGLWSRVDKKTGEIKAKKNKIYDAGLFNQIEVQKDSFEVRSLKRRLPEAEKQNLSHRPLFNENAVAMHFLKLIEITSPQKKSIYLQGFLALEELKKCLQKKSEGRFDSYKKYGGILEHDEVEKYIPLYKEQFKIKEGTGAAPFEKFGDRQESIRVYSLDKKKVYAFLIDNFNTRSSPAAWRKTDIKILETLCQLWYFTQRKNIITKDSNKEKIYSLKPNDLKAGGFINPQIENAWNDVRSKVDESKDIYKQLREYFLYKNNKKHGHQRLRKDFSLPIAKSKGFLIRKKSWKGEYVYYCRPASSDFSQTVLHRDKDDIFTGKDERLSNVYRRHNIFFCFESFKDLKEKLCSVDKNLAIDANLYYEAQIPKEFKSFIIKVENRRTDTARPRFRFFLNTKKRMGFESFRKFILRYPFRTLQDLRSDLRKKYFGTEEKADKINCLRDLKASIKKIEKMKEKPNNLLSALQLYREYWESSRKSNKLEYQAKGSFTISEKS